LNAELLYGKRLDDREMPVPATVVQRRDGIEDGLGAGIDRPWSRGVAERITGVRVPAEIGGLAREVEGRVDGTGVDPGLYWRLHGLAACMTERLVPAPLLGGSVWGIDGEGCQQSAGRQ
jgi:hypothetical protein